MAELIEYFKHDRKCLRMVSRLLNDGDPMTINQLIETSGMSGASIRKCLQVLKVKKLIHVDHWTLSPTGYRVYIPVFRKGNLEDAPKPTAKNKYLMRKRSENTEKPSKNPHFVQPSDTDWNDIMNGFVKAHPLEK